MVNAQAVSRIAANEMSRLWQAHSILELSIKGIGDEVDNGGPAIKPALQAAADLIFASINGLEPICTPEELEVQIMSDAQPKPAFADALGKILHQVNFTHCTLSTASVAFDKAEDERDFELLSNAKVTVRRCIEDLETIRDDIGTLEDGLASAEVQS